MNRSTKKNDMIFEIFILVVTALILAFIYLAYVMLQVYQLKKNILSKIDDLALQLRHITDLYIFHSNSQDLQPYRKNFLNSSTLSDKVFTFIKINKFIKQQSPKTYSAKYVEALTLSHQYNNNLLQLSKKQSNFLYKLITKLSFSEFKRLDAISIA